MSTKLLLLGLGVFTAVLAVWLFVLEVRLKRIFRGRGGMPLEGLLSEITRELEELRGSGEEMKKYLETVERRLKRSAQYVGMVRFNPFQDAGGDQSFAIAVMDEKKNGVVVSSLYGREVSRMYAKPLEAGQSRYQLSLEEKRAIEEALREEAS